METARRRRGPRPQGPFEDKRKTLTTRITEDMRTKLEASAARSGRSLSQEIELRLLRSYRDDDWLDATLDLAYGKRNVGVLLLLGRILRDASAFAGVAGMPDWLDDYGEFDAVARALGVVVAALRPATVEEADKEHQAARYAGAALLLAGEDDPARRLDWAQMVRAKLGSVGDRLSRARTGLSTTNEKEPGR